MQQICESIETLQAASGPPDVLAVLDWALGQPQHRAHPRQLFLITAASPTAATTHQTLEFMRWHRGAARYGAGRRSQSDRYSLRYSCMLQLLPFPARCFSFALAPACHQLLHGLSVLSRGQAYVLRAGERLQPKVSVRLCLLTYS